MALVKYNQHSLQQYCSHVENTCMTASFHLREVVWAYKTSLLFHFHLRDMVWAYKTSLLLHFHLSAYTKPGDFASISTIFRLEVRTVLTVLYIFFFIL